MSYDDEDTTTSCEQRHQVLASDELEVLSDLEVQLSTCCQQLGLDALQRAADLLRHHRGCSVAGRARVTSLVI